MSDNTKNGLGSVNQARLTLVLHRCRLALLAVLILTSGCATSGMKRVDRSSGSPTRGFVEFRIEEGADFSIMREPVTVYITREGEKRRLGFVGSDVNWAPLGYVHQLIVTETLGVHTYGYVYQTMGKSLVTLGYYPHGWTGVAFFGLEHCDGTVSIEVLDGKTTPVVFSLGPKEVKGTGISRRLDPTQFNGEQGPPYEGKPERP